MKKFGFLFLTYGMTLIQYIYSVGLFKGAALTGKANTVLDWLP